MSRMVLIARLLAMEYAERDETIAHSFYFTMKDIGMNIKVTVGPDVVDTPCTEWVQAISCRG
jgi:hypothetical protein